MFLPSNSEGFSEASQGTYIGAFPQFPSAVTTLSKAQTLTMTIYDLPFTSAPLPLETEGDTYSLDSRPSDTSPKSYLAAALTARFEEDRFSYRHNGTVIDP
jgi:hypothetical protein